MCIDGDREFVEDAYDVGDDVMREVLTVFIEGESRTVINEGARGSLLQSYRATEETDLVGRIAEWYADLARAYNSELGYVKENISPTLRRLNHVVTGRYIQIHHFGT